MGWAGGNEIFDPVARKAQELRLSARQRTELLAVLIYEMQMRDWDTEGESLGEFQGDEAVVEAFRQNQVIIRCGAQETMEGGWCKRERGPRGHADGMHEDDRGTSWPAVLEPEVLARTPEGVRKVLSAQFAEYEEGRRESAGFHIGDGRESRGEILVEVLGGLDNPPCITDAEREMQRGMLRRVREVLAEAGYNVMIESHQVVIRP